MLHLFRWLLLPSSGSARSTWILAFVAVIGSASSVTGQATGSIEPPLREAWTRGGDRFLRQWLVAVVSDRSEATLRVDQDDMTVGQLATGTDPTGPRWLPLQSFGDVIDFAGAPAVAPPRGDANERRVWAVTTTTGPAVGPAEVLVGADGRFRVWVNGTLVADQEKPRELGADELRVPVELRPGRNVIHAEFRHTPRGDWRATVRLVPPGAPVRPLQDFWPQFREDGAQLIVGVEPAVGGGQAPVRVQFIQPGGRVAAELTLPRGTSESINPTRWPDGPYDVRFESPDAWGTPVVAYLPWFKGDIAAAIRELEAAVENAAPGPRQEHLRVLAELVRARRDSGAVAATAVHSPLFEFAELKQAAASDARVRSSGFVRLAWIDEVDGSTQFARAYLPRDYSPDRQWPLVVSLHGYNPPNPPYAGWWAIAARHNSLAEQKAVILVEPHGRGNAQYRGIGERDVLRAIAEAKRAFAIDDERVYLTGESMGGSGTWLIGSRHPGLFAAIAPVYGGWDFRVDGMGAPTLTVTSPPEAFRAELRNSFSNAENLRNVPVLVLHGDEDPAVSVEHSRHAVRLLQRWSYDIQYRELPGWAHEDLNRRGEIIDWLLQHRRAAAPRVARVRSPNLAGARADWVQVERMQEVERVIRVDAEVLAPGHVRLDTDNVAALTLTLPSPLRGPGAVVRVVWNGRPHEVPTGDRLRLGATDGATPAWAKVAGVEGPLSSIVEKPFLVVIGTSSSDPRMREFCAAKGNALATQWRTWQHQDLRLRRDVDVSTEEANAHSLILIGGADANTITAQLSRALPFTIAGEQVTVDGRTWTAPDAVLEMIYPHPQAPGHQVVVVAGTSAAGLYFWRPQFVHPSFGFPVSAWDWTLQDGRAATEPGDDPEALMIAAGVFDALWRRQDSHTVEGQPERRSRARLRHAPPPGFVPSTGALQTYAGDYQLPSGYRFTLLPDGARLLVQAPGQPTAALVAESDEAFVDPVSGDWVHFRRGPDGAVVLTALRDGTILQAAKSVAE